MRKAYRYRERHVVIEKEKATLLAALLDNTDL
jgi:hypothetical protein